ncbi:hypothetical protein HMSSN036_17020 [Paenibacillus macerans]|nr:hypothetical protein HMSSN036_17020 [Paenibacillus macerans]
MLGKTISFSYDIRTDYVTASYVPLLTLMNNLTANAVEAIGENGMIHLEVGEHGGYTVFIVADSGGGVAERDRDLLFEPGFTTKFDQEGVAATGIGLSHVRDIVSMFAGEVEVGSIFRFGGRAVSGPHSDGKAA